VKRGITRTEKCARTLCIDGRAEKPGARRKKLEIETPSQGEPKKMKTRKYLKYIIALPMMLLAIAGSAEAQSIVTGALSGTVTDSTGAVIADATVTLVSESTQETQTATTGPNGTFQFSLLKPGRYDVTVEKSGFKRATQKPDVMLGQTASLNVRLEIGEASQTVEITESTPLLQTEDANITSNVDLRTLANMPNPGGDLSYVAQIAPGVTMNTSNGGGYGNFTAYGLPATANLFTINGNDYNDPFLNLNNSGASNLLLGSNEVQEVAVVSNGYTGQYGRQAGAQVDYTTKSGGNAFHGDAVYNWNGSALNANDFFLNAAGQPRPFENNNQWAASLGGPIKRNKAFFFINTEGIRYIFGSSQQVFVPTPELQSFILNTSLPANNPAAIPFYQQMFSLYNSAPGVANAQPVAGSDSCASLTAFTGPCLAQYRVSVPNGNREWLLSGRVDYNFTDNDKVYGRVKFDRGNQPTYTDPINPAFNIQSNQPQDEGQLNYTHIYNPRVVNNFIGSVLYYSALFQSPNLSNALSTFPFIVSTNDSSLTPLGSGSGIFPPFAIFPQGRNVTQWQLVDDLSIEHGRHAFKVGVNFRRDDVSDFTASQGSYPAIESSMADFAAGFADVIQQNFALHTSQPLAFYSFGVYGQDEFRVSQKLKLTLALRADRNSGGTCQSNCVARASQPFQTLNHDPSVPYNQMLTTGGSQILPDVEKVVIEPRLGVAFSPSGKTVIRGGIGLFSDLYPGTLLNLFTTNFPQVTAFSLAGLGSIDAMANPNSAAAIIGQCNTAFQGTFSSGGTVNDFLNSSPAGCATPNLNDVGKKLSNPKYLEWNVMVQHTLGTRLVLSANYVGNHGYDGILENPYLNSFGYAGLPTTAVDTRVQNVLEVTNHGFSNYNGLTLAAQEQFGKGFSGQFSYTFSHALDNISNGGVLPYSLNDSILFQIDPFSARTLNYSNSDYDVRHSLNAAYVWDLPVKFGNHIVNSVVGGWTVSGTFFYRTGLPFSVVDGITTGNLQSAGTNLQNVTVLGEPITNVPRDCGSSAVNNACLTTAQFASGAGVSGFGTIPRNSFRGPGYFNTDLSLRKTFHFTERVGFQIGASAYNVLNHANFANPNSNLASSNFGMITNAVQPPTSPYGAFAAAATDARILQVMGKITF
jgi:hypothetical protein